jgi:DNA-binding transcriptional regulator YiaG
MKGDTPLPELLRSLRKTLGGVSQEQLAHRVGVTWSTVNRWENGRGNPSPLARQKLDQLLEEAGLKGRRAAVARKAKNEGLV